MADKSTCEENIPLDYIDGECSVNKLIYNADNLTVVLDSFTENREISIEFVDIFAYRVTLEHFRWSDIRVGRNPLYIVSNSNYLKWIMDSGMALLGETPPFPVYHFLISTTEHIIDILSPVKSFYLNKIS